ncbi:SDR family NAD(P)-dependent oxidoreductase [Kitasatospora sp. MBT63]|uniref:SDR family NAD(P)-dependent oxidoreductase n=1 Tax=Kitasatospora sp. MBT63 TaxID=1444768 RepID=UPI0006899B42|nr:SDR family NAD(P)-dependent oxidoreductase [Kitasatospora sp. MBT63]
MARSYKPTGARPTSMVAVKLHAQRTLITGGTSGVGRALATALTAHGAKVAVCGRRADPARTDVIELRADLARPGEAARVVEQAAARLGGLDLVIANAGVQYPSPLTGGPRPELLARAREEIEVNLASVAELAAACWPHLAAGERTAFVAIGSGLGYAPKRSAPVYCATKAGLRILVEALRHQAAAATPGVQVQEVVLPLVDTAMTAGREGPARKLTPEQAADAILAGIRRGRPVVPVGATRPLLALLRVAPGLGRRILRNG